MNQATLENRAKLRAYGDHVIGVRRPAASVSRTIEAPDDTWRLNHRMDCLSVGPKVPKDAIKTGDVIFTLPKGDSHSIGGKLDPQLECTWFDRKTDSHIRIWVKTESFSAVEISTGRTAMAVELDHLWNYEKADGSFQMFQVGDFRLMWLPGLEIELVTADDFAQRFRTAEVQERSA